MLLIDIALGLVAILTFLLIVTTLYQLISRVPFVPTPKHIAHAMIELANLTSTETVIDLGAGDGRLLERAKKLHPNIRAIGVELVPTVWLLGWVRSKILRSGVRIKLGSMFSQDVSHADVIFLYLFPGLMKKLETKFERELRPGTIVITQTFGFKNRTPVKTVVLPRLGGGIAVYRYEW